MLDTNKVIKVVKNTPLEKIDNEAVMIGDYQSFGFSNWQGIQNPERWFGCVVYRTASGLYISGQGTSAKGYTTKENALKYAVIDFESRMEEFGKDWGDVAKVK